MSASPRPPKEESPTTRPVSGSMILLGTALDTTWRAFVPTLGGTFLGIWLDSSFGTAPLAVFICLAVGVLTSAVLIARQLIVIRKNQ